MNKLLLNRRIARNQHVQGGKIQSGLVGVSQARRIAAPLEHVDFGSPTPPQTTPKLINYLLNFGVGWGVGWVGLGGVCGVVWGGGGALIVCRGGVILNGAPARKCCKS